MHIELSVIWQREYIFIKRPNIEMEMKSMGLIVSQNPPKLPKCKLK